MTDSLEECEIPCLEAATCVDLGLSIHIGVYAAERLWDTDQAWGPANNSQFLQITNDVGAAPL